ncbi:MAG: VPLPA-CTERM sorting domain-containing protein [Rhodobacteraceae bacterium]|nr:MAG: VPLPA-CTERM sorting domain-containing protein [Paracoccaceae bacterium]
MFHQKLSAFAAAALVAFGIGDKADAATCNTANFVESSQCIPRLSDDVNGNVSVADMNGFGGTGAFGKTNWKEIGKIDGGESSAFFTITGLGETSGTWELTFPWTWHPDAHYVFVLKGGAQPPNNQNAVANVGYLVLNSIGNRSGTWSTADLLNPGGNVPGLSNITLFGTEDLKPIPLPAAAWLLLSGMAGLGVMGARKRKAQAA